MSTASILKTWFEQNRPVLLYGLELFLIAVIFFALSVAYAGHAMSMGGPSVALAEQAFISTPGIAPDQTTELSSQPTFIAQPSTATVAGEYVASRSGKTYYLVTCSNRIKEENKIFFATAEDAEKAGLTPSKTCFK